MAITRGVHVENSGEQLEIGKPPNIWVPFVAFPVGTVVATIVITGRNNQWDFSRVSPAEIKSTLIGVAGFAFLATCGAAIWQMMFPSYFRFDGANRVLYRWKKRICSFDDIRQIHVANRGSSVNLYVTLANGPSVSIAKLPLTIPSGRWRPIEELSEIAQTISDITSCKEIYVNRIPPTQIQIPPGL